MFLCSCLWFGIGVCFAYIRCFVFVVCDRCLWLLAVVAFVCGLLDLVWGCVFLFFVVVFVILLSCFVFWGLFKFVVCVRGVAVVLLAVVVFVWGLFDLCLGCVSRFVGVCVLVCCCGVVLLVFA